MKRAILAALLAGAAPAAAADRDLAAAFGARETIEDISLSTDGKKAAIIRPDGPRGSVLMVADLATGGTARILATTGDPEKLQYCRWTTPTRMVCGVYVNTQLDGRPTPVTRMIAIDADGKNLKVLTQRTSSRALGPLLYGGDVIDWTGDGEIGSVLMMRAYVEEKTIGTNIRGDRDGMGVDRVNTETLQRRAVEGSKPNVTEYITDGIGHVRVMGTIGHNVDGYSGDTITYSYRKAGQDSWLPLGKFRIDLESGGGFNPYAVDPAQNAVYGFDDANGRKALFKIALDGSAKKELVLARPDVDVDGLIRIGRQRRVVGASYAVEQRQVDFFDPELKKLAVSLGKALPKLPLIRFVDASADEKQLLLHASSDTDPGRYYVFDKATRNLAEVLPSRAELVGVPLGTMKAVSYRAADGSMIPAYLTLPAGSNGKGLPAIVMPHGGPSARDEWGFDWLSQYFAARGYAVLQPNYRGSSGYGDAWFEKNGFQSWRTAIGDINDGARWLEREGIAAPGKLAIFGWSYGGYAALQSPMLDPNLFKAIVAVAPVTDLDLLRSQYRGFSNYYLADRFIGTGPHVAAGSPARHAGEIKAPVLLFHGDRDINVAVAESRLMADRLRDAGKKVEYVEYKGLDHQLDDSAARAEMLGKSDAFIRAALGL